MIVNAVRKRILVVDDDADILEVLKILLESTDYEAETLPNAGRIYGKIASFKPDLILLDVLLSGTDGRNICKKLKSDKMTKLIPVIMLSAHPEAKKTIKKYGADAFVEKPFDVDALLNRIEEFV